MQATLAPFGPLRKLLERSWEPSVTSFFECRATWVSIAPMKTPFFRLAALAASLAFSPVLLHSAQTAPEGVTAKPLRGNLVLLEGPLANCVALTGPEGTILVDSGEDAAYAAAMEKALPAESGKVRFLFNTHKHFDHVNGNAYFAGKGAVLLAQESVRRELAEEGEVPPEALPTVLFADTMSLHLDGEDVLLFHPQTGGAHTNGDSVAFFPKADVLVAGDLFCNGMFPYLDPKGGNVPGIVKSLRLVAERIGEHTLVVPGHGALTDRQGLLHYADLLESAHKAVTSLMEEGKSLDEILALQPTAPLDAELGSLTIRMFGKNYRSDPDTIVRMIYKSNLACGLGKPGSK